MAKAAKNLDDAVCCLVITADSRESLLPNIQQGPRGAVCSDYRPDGVFFNSSVAEQLWSPLPGCHHPVFQPFNRRGVRHDQGISSNLIAADGTPIRLFLIMSVAESSGQI